MSAEDNVPFNPDSPTYFFFKAPRNSEQSKYLLPVHLQLKNTSNGNNDEARMVISYDRRYLRAQIPKEAMTTNGIWSKDEERYEVSSDDLYDYVKYAATFLAPKTSRSFTDAAFATAIPWKQSDPIFFNSNIGLDVQVHTYSKGDIDRKWYIRYRGLNVNTDEELVEVVKKWYASQLAREIRRESGFWGYILKLIFRKEIMIYSYSPEFRFISEKNLFIPTVTPTQFKAYKVYPYSFSLLFDFSQ